jgi:hypothetical protein
MATSRQLKELLASVGILPTKQQLKAMAGVLAREQPALSRQVADPQAAAADLPALVCAALRAGNCVGGLPSLAMDVWPSPARPLLQRCALDLGNYTSLTPAEWRKALEAFRTSRPYEWAAVARLDDGATEAPTASVEAFISTLHSVLPFDRVGQPPLPLSYDGGEDDGAGFTKQESKRARRGQSAAGNSPAQQQPRQSARLAAAALSPPGRPYWQQASTSSQALAEAGGAADCSSAPPDDSMTGGACSEATTSHQ